MTLFVKAWQKKHKTWKIILGDKIEKIMIISNYNFTPDKNFKDKRPCSYNYFRFQTALENRNIGLNFIKQDKNYVYFQAYDKTSKKTARIMAITYGELLRFDVRMYYQEIMDVLK